MKKRLILILAFVFVAGLSMAAYAEVQNVKVSGDITAYGIERILGLKGRRDISTSGSGQDQQEYRTLATITRLRVDADLTDNVMTTVRLLNERYWGTEAWGRGIFDYGAIVNENGDHNTAIDLDLAYVTLKEFLCSPLTLTIGRQELHFGNEMIVGDPDTNAFTDPASVFSNFFKNRDADLSARKSFDAIRATLNYDPLVIDGVMAKIQENSRYRQDDVDLYGVNANYKIGGKYNAVAEAYWFEKRTGRGYDYGSSLQPADMEHGKKVDHVDTFGARIAGSPRNRVTSSLEVAIQRGKFVPIEDMDSNTHTVKRKAWAAEAATSVDLTDKIKYAPTVTALYAYFSGNHEQDYSTDQGAYRGWDPMFENQKYGDIANALLPQTNVHILGGIATAQLMEDVKLKAEYYAFWWAKAFVQDEKIGTIRDPNAGYTMTDKRFAGQEIDLTATYDYTEDVQFALMAGALIPGGSFDDGNNTPAKEVIGSMKVTF